MASLALMNRSIADLSGSIVYVRMNIVADKLYGKTTVMGVLNKILRNKSN